MQKKSGQIGLLLLVVMGLVVGIALSLASRSLGDTVLSRQESESAKAFRLAETGVEQALNELRVGNVPNPLTLSGEGTFTGSAQVAGFTSYELFVKEGEVAHLDVVGFAPGNLQIRWSRKEDKRESPDSCSLGSGNTPAAIEVITHKNDGSSTFDYYNPAGCSPEDNGFAAATTEGGDYLSLVSNFSVLANALSVRIRPIYADATIAVEGAGLSTQFYLIQSMASGGDAQKEIEVKRGLDSAASIFDYALFSGSSIEK